MKRPSFCFIVFFFAVFLIPFSHALLISPAKVEFSQYVPGGSEEFDVTIINDNAEDIIIDMSYESWEGKINYAEYFRAVDYENNKVPISAGSSQTIHFVLQYPELEQFGTVRFATIRFYQVPLSSDGSTIAATVAVRIPLETQAAYPEKYVKIEMEDFAVAEPGEEVELHSILTNLGQNVLQSVSGVFILRQGENSYSYPFVPLQLFLQSESQTVSAIIDTSDLPSGKYSVLTHVEYDGESRDSFEKIFIIGEKNVEILGLGKDYFSEGGSDTITVSLLSYWVEDMNVALNVDLLSIDGEVLQSSSFGSYTLPAAEKKDISSGFDFSQYDIGAYILRVRVDLEGQEIIKEYPISLIPTNEFSAPEEENSVFMYLIIIVLLVLLFALVIGYIIYRKRQGTLV
ncbi:MAG: hypothetical protein Q8R18_01785 [bacterium]|nr:hypothetical protein [bacterium]